MSGEDRKALCELLFICETTSTHEYPAKLSEWVRRNRDLANQLWHSHQLRMAKMRPN